MARYSIHMLIVQHRAHQTTVTPEALFKSAIKAHFRFKFKLSCMRQNLESFRTTWCLGEAFARVDGNHLVLIHSNDVNRLHLL